MEVQICMIDAVFCELLLLILCFVQTDDVSHSEMLKHLNIVIRCIASILIFLVYWSHKSNELSW